MPRSRPRRASAAAADSVSAAPPLPRSFPTALLPVLGICALALLLRLWGIGWALPNAARFFSYHPDESVVVLYSLVVNPFLLLLDPGFYNYGSLSLLLNGAVIHLGEGVGLIEAGPGPGIPSAGALLAARLITAFLGAATCAFLYGTGRVLYGGASGIIAALLYAVAPLAVQHGHFATVDVPATFWIAGCLYFAARYAAGETRRRPRDLFWCGLWAGLAAATKYNASLALFAGLAAWWLGGRQIPPARNLVIGAALGFVVGCPGILLNPSALLAGIAYEAQHVREGHGIVFARTPPGLLYHWTFNLRWGLGLPLMLLALIGAGSGLYRRRPADLILLAFALPYYLLIGLAQVKFARYTLPLFPPLLLLVGSLLPPAPDQAKSYRRIALGAIGAAVAYALCFSLAIVSVLRQTDPRDQAASFLRAERGIASVGFAKGPWFFSPPLGPQITHPFPPVAQESARTVESPRLFPAVGPDGQPVEWSVDLLRATPPDAVVMSEFEYADAERIGYPPAMEYLEALLSAYPNRRVFANPMQVFGLSFTKVSDTGRLPLPSQSLPEDMRYANPATIVFTR